MLHPLFIPFAFTAKHRVVNEWNFLREIQTFQFKKTKLRTRHKDYACVSEQAVMHVAKLKWSHPRFFPVVYIKPAIGSQPSRLSLAEAQEVWISSCSAWSFQGVSTGWKDLMLGHSCLTLLAAILHSLVNHVMPIHKIKWVVLMWFGGWRFKVVYNVL